MFIQCTKILLEKLKIESRSLTPVEECDDGADGFYSWHANLITINRRKAVVLMNNLTRYIIVLYRPRQRDLTDIDESFKKALFTAFREEGVAEEIIYEYIEKCGQVKYSRTAGRSMTSYLNKACETVKIYQDRLDEGTVIQKEISPVTGRYFVPLNGVYQYPGDMLIKELCKMHGMPENESEKIIRQQTYQLKIKLAAGNYDIWRRVLIPANRSFAKLHQVIQETFGWFNYHLHEFFLPDETQQNCDDMPVYAKPVKMRILDARDPEIMEYAERDRYEIKPDADTRLADIFEDNDKCYYVYDFGDYWLHEITLEKVTDGHDRFPVLVERKGERPPEDVGGEDGFEMYMRIISDKSHPEYDDIVRWAEYTRAKEKTIEEINKSLKYMW